jgi:hypothetical protein
VIEVDLDGLDPWHRHMLDRVQAFTHEMQQKKIHVGVGIDEDVVRCAYCREVWPCSRQELVL